MPTVDLKRTCGICGTLFYAQCAARVSRAKFCSVRCRKKAHFLAQKRGKDNNNWKGGIVTAMRTRPRGDGSFYGQRLIYAPEYCKATGRKGPYVAEHILLAERALGRKLKKAECVHHINCDPMDNRPENLLVCTNGYHSYLHHKMSELYAKETFSRAS